MYKKTRRYGKLKTRMKELENHLVKNLLTKNSLDFTPRDMDLCRGFKVLCHAELEDYFEEISKILVYESEYAWQNDKKILLPIVGLLGNFEKIETNDTIDTKIHKIMRDYREKIIKKNHGVKSENLKRMYANLGIDCERFEVIWLNLLDSFGSERGIIAHTSARTQNPINIRDTITDLERITDAIENFEKEIESQSKINLYAAEKRYQDHYRV